MTEIDFFDPEGDSNCVKDLPRLAGCGINVKYLDIVYTYLGGVVVVVVENCK